MFGISYSIIVSGVHFALLHALTEPFYVIKFFAWSRGVVCVCVCVCVGGGGGF